MTEGGKGGKRGTFCKGTRGKCRPLGKGTIKGDFRGLIGEKWGNKETLKKGIERGKMWNWQGERGNSRPFEG